MLNTKIRAPLKLCFNTNAKLSSSFTYSAFCKVYAFGILKSSTVFNLVSILVLHQLFKFAICFLPSFLLLRQIRFRVKRRSQYITFLLCRVITAECLKLCHDIANGCGFARSGNYRNAKCICRFSSSVFSKNKCNFFLIPIHCLQKYQPLINQSSFLIIPFAIFYTLSRILSKITQQFCLYQNQESPIYKASRYFLPIRTQLSYLSILHFCRILLFL